MDAFAKSLTTGVLTGSFDESLCAQMEPQIQQPSTVYQLLERVATYLQPHEKHLSFSKLHRSLSIPSSIVAGPGSSSPSAPLSSSLSPMPIGAAVPSPSASVSSSPSPSFIEQQAQQVASLPSSVSSLSAAPDQQQHLASNQLLTLFLYLECFLSTWSFLERIPHPYHILLLKNLSTTSVDLTQCLSSVALELLHRSTEFRDTFLDHYFLTLDSSQIRILTSFAEQHPKIFFAKLSENLEKESTRFRASELLLFIAHKRIPRLHEIKDTSIPEIVLSFLLKREKDHKICVVLSWCILMMFHIFLEVCCARNNMPDLFAIFRRMLSWQADVSLEILKPSDILPPSDSRHALALFFHHLYSTVPCSFVRYLRGQCTLSLEFQELLKPLVKNLRFNSRLLLTEDEELSAETWRRTDHERFITQFLGSDFSVPSVVSDSCSDAECPCRLPMFINNVADDNNSSSNSHLESVLKPLVDWEASYKKLDEMNASQGMMMMMIDASPSLSSSSSTPQPPQPQLDPNSLFLLHLSRLQTSLEQISPFASSSPSSIDGPLPESLLQSLLSIGDSSSNQESPLQATAHYLLSIRNELLYEKYLRTRQSMEIRKLRRDQSSSAWFEAEQMAMLEKIKVQHSELKRLKDQLQNQQRDERELKKRQAKWESKLYSDMEMLQRKVEMEQHERASLQAQFDQERERVESLRSELAEVASRELKQGGGGLSFNNNSNNRGQSPPAADEPQPQQQQQQTVQYLQDVISSLESDLHDWESKQQVMEESIRQAEELKGKLQAAERLASALSEYADSTQDGVSQLKSRLIEMAERMNGLERERDALTETCKSLKGTLDTVKLVESEKRSALEAKYQTIKNLNLALERRVSSLIADLESLKYDSVSPPSNNSSSSSDMYHHHSRDSSSYSSPRIVSRSSTVHQNYFQQPSVGVGAVATKEVKQLPSVVVSSLASASASAALAAAAAAAAQQQQQHQAAIGPSQASSGLASLVVQQQQRYQTAQQPAISRPRAISSANERSPSWMSTGPPNPSFEFTLQKQSVPNFDDKESDSLQ